MWSLICLELGGVAAGMGVFVTIIVHNGQSMVEYLAGKIAGLDDDDAAALQEQLRLAQGISGPCCA